jgi:hypothetical protein
MYLYSVLLVVQDTRNTELDLRYNDSKIYELELLNKSTPLHRITMNPCMQCCLVQFQPTHKFI